MLFRVKEHPSATTTVDMETQLNIDWHDKLSDMLYGKAVEQPAAVQSVQCPAAHPSALGKRDGGPERKDAGRTQAHAL